MFNGLHSLQASDKQAHTPCLLTHTAALPMTKSISPRDALMFFGRVPTPPLRHFVDSAAGQIHGTLSAAMQDVALPGVRVD